MPKNHTDKQRFAAVSSCRDRDLNFTFPRANNGVLDQVLYQPPHSRSSRISDLKIPIIMSTDTIEQASVNYRPICRPILGRDVDQYLGDSNG